MDAIHIPGSNHGFLISSPVGSGYGDDIVPVDRASDPKTALPKTIQQVVRLSAKSNPGSHRVSHPIQPSAL